MSQSSHRVEELATTYGPVLRIGPRPWPAVELSGVADLLVVYSPTPGDLSARVTPQQLTEAVTSFVPYRGQPVVLLLADQNLAMAAGTAWSMARDLGVVVYVAEGVVGHLPGRLVATDRFWRAHPEEEQLTPLGRFLPERGRESPPATANLQGREGAGVEAAVPVDLSGLSVTLPVRASARPLSFSRGIATTDQLVETASVVSHSGERVDLTEILWARIADQMRLLGPDPEDEVVLAPVSPIDIPDPAARYVVVLSVPVQEPLQGAVPDQDPGQDPAAAGTSGTTSVDGEVTAPTIDMDADAPPSDRAAHGSADEQLPGPGDRSCWIRLQEPVEGDDTAVRASWPREHSFGTRAITEVLAENPALRRQLARPERLEQLVALYVVLRGRTRTSHVLRGALPPRAGDLSLARMAAAGARLLPSASGTSFIAVSYDEDVTASYVTGATVTEPDFLLAGGTTVPGRSLPSDSVLFVLHGRNGRQIRSVLGRDAVLHPPGSSWTVLEVVHEVAPWRAAVLLADLGRDADPHGERALKVRERMRTAAADGALPGRVVEGEATAPGRLADAVLFERTSE